MKNYINGFAAPGFIITDLSTGSQSNINLVKYIQFSQEHCSEEWLESIDLSGNIRRKFKGYRFSWSLHFEDYLENDNMSKLDSILTALSDNQNYSVKFIPSTDEPTRYFSVTTAQDAAYSIRHSQSPEASSVMEGFVLELRAVSLTPHRNWLDPNRQKYTADINPLTGFINE